MKTILMLSTLLLAGVPAFAMRCDDGLVNAGFLTYEVIERCGEPVLRQAWVERDFGLGPPRYVDEWLYELGRTKFRRLLRFENGRLIRITKQKKPRRLAHKKPRLVHKEPRRLLHKEPRRLYSRF